MNENFQNSSANDSQSVSNSQNTIGQQTQQNIQNTQFVSEQQMKPPVVNSQFGAETVVSSGNKPNKFSSELFILIGVIVAILVGFACYYFINMNNPTNIYRKLIEKGIDGIFEVVNQNEDKINSTFNLDFDLDLEQELLDQSLLDLINKTTIGFNYQLDKKSEQLVLKIDSNYGKESLIDLQMFIDNKNKKTYLYAKDYYDKYLEIEMEDYSSFAELFDDEKLTFGQKISSKKAKKIMKDEFTKIIKKEDCSKEDGTYVLIITEKDLLDRLKTAITNLKNNQKFLDCYEDPDGLKETMSSFIDEIDETSASSEPIKISISKKFFSTKIDKFVVDGMGDELIFENKDKKTTYKLNSEDELVLKGYIKKAKEKNTTELEISVQVPDLGELKIDLDITDEKNKDIDKVKTSKIKSFDDITEAELNEILAKIQDSKLYELVMSALGSLEMNGDNTDTEFDYDYNDNSDSSSTSDSSDTINVYDYKNIKLSIPEGFTNTYSSDNYKMYKKDDVEIAVRAGFYDSKDEFFKTLDSKVKYTKEYDYYRDVVLSEEKTKTVDGKKFYYKDYSYEYVGVVSNTKYLEKYFCYNVGDHYYLIIEVVSKNSVISDNVLNTILSIK